MNRPSPSRSTCLPWLAGFLLAACAAAGPQSGQTGAPDAFYKMLNADETAMARRAVQKALETRRSNEVYRWDSGNGAFGSVIPLRTFRIKSGHYCRDYSESIVKSVNRASAERRACRDRRGCGSDVG